MQKCSIALCLVPLQLSLLPPLAGLVGPQARELPVSSCVWNPDTFHLSTTRDSHQSDQPCILHIPGINGIIRKAFSFVGKAALTFSTRILHLPFTYILQPTTTIPSVQRTWKEFLPSLDLGKTATKREQQDWHQQGRSIDIWTLSGLMFTYLIWSMTLPLQRIHKELLPQFLSCCTDDEEEFFYFTITLDNCSLLLLTIQEHPK